MPNWCNNTATITLPTPELAAEFIENCTIRPSAPVPGTLLDMTEPWEPELFNTYYPIPDFANGDGWYNWCCANWGTKWNPSIDSVSKIDDCTIIIMFDTAWSPPLEWLDYCGQVHNWKWELAYIELGMGFAGTASGDKDGRYSDDNFTDDDPDYKSFGTEYFGIEWDNDDDDTITL